MDLSGYGIAARKYLEILDLVAEKNNIDLKVYICLSPFAPPNLNTFSPKEQQLIKKYSFGNDEEITEFIKNNDYEVYLIKEFSCNSKHELEREERK